MTRLSSIRAHYFCHKFTRNNGIVLPERKIMSLAALSPETKIRSILAALDCKHHHFAEISGVVGKTRFAQGLAGEKDFDQHDAIRMLDVLTRMMELQEAVIAPVNWSKTTKVRDALAVRLAAKIEREDHNSNQLDAAADAATASVMREDRDNNNETA
jgi:hypothetical protein